MSRVARKREVARRRLVAAAIELIADKGVEGLRLREITDLADIGFGSFYNHFESKEELVEVVVAEYVGSVTQAIIDYAGSLPDPAETVAVAHLAFLRLAFEEPRLAWLIVHLDRADALLETASVPRLGPVLERGIASGRFAEVEAGVAVSFIVGATMTVMRGILDGRLGFGADVESARLLLRTCGLPDAEALSVASRPLDWRPQPEALVTG